MTKPRLLVLSLGGTITMVPSVSGGIAPKLGIANQRGEIATRENRLTQLLKIGFDGRDSAAAQARTPVGDGGSGRAGATVALPPARATRGMLDLYA